MKIRIIKLHLCFFALILLLLTSCYRSHFATTTRINKNGKETFTNWYQYKSRRSLKNNSHNNRINNVDKQLTLYSGSKIILMPEIAGITFVTEIQSENMIASTGIEPVFTVFKDKNECSNASQRMLKNGRLHPNAIVKSNQIQAGQKETLPADNRKIEKYGLSGFILSIPGLVPIVCLPLAILGVIFGSISLRKIKRNRALYKGKGYAIASIILGVLGILGVLLFIG